MRLAAQLTTDIVAFDITSKGRAYVFVDTSAEPTGTLVWQSGGNA